MAGQRHQRDADLRALARLMGEGNRTSLAEKIFQRVDRYRPAPVETSPGRIASEKFWASKKLVWLPKRRRQIEPNRIIRGRMASVPTVTTDLAVQIGSRKVALTPAAAFTLAEQLIRGATRAIVQSEADRTVVLDAVRDNREITQ